MWKIKNKSSNIIKPTQRNHVLDELGGLMKKRDAVWEGIIQTHFSTPPAPVRNINGGTMDAAPSVAMQSQFNTGNDSTLDTLLLDWYGSQGFIGWPMCAIASQNWLIDKACGMPAFDAARNGYDVVVTNSPEVDPKLLEQIKEEDEKYKIQENIVEFVKMTRVFGLRLAMFVIDVDDPKDFYSKPFNIDAVPEGSYRGIAQIDPYWTAPLLDIESSTPGSIRFYDPTWWKINNIDVHYTHLIVGRNGTLPDILKPTYLYGSVSLTQKIMERVYAAERTANEAPMLAMTKRTGILNMDMTQAMANFAKVQERLTLWTYIRDNYGVRVLDMGDTYTQHDTALADLDAIIMTQYQLVAAEAEVPAVKLMGTSPKGFGASGEYEERSYHQMLQGLQTNLMTPIIQRHHELLIKSKISPNAPFATKIKWNALDAPGAEQQANINKIKAETGAALVGSGAIGPEDERVRVATDPSSGYDGLSLEAPVREVDDLGIGELLGLDEPKQETLFEAPVDEENTV